MHANPTVVLVHGAFADSTAWNPVLRILEEIQLGDIVTEAREVAELAPADTEESEDERKMVRSSARELNELSKRELSTKGGAGGAKAASGRPLRASDVRAKRTALSSGSLGGRRPA